MKTTRSFSRSHFRNPRWVFSHLPLTPTKILHCKVRFLRQILYLTVLLLLIYTAFTSDLIIPFLLGRIESFGRKIVISRPKRPYQGLHLHLVHPLPILANRFNQPWYVPPRVKLLTLEQSRHRILYSPLRHSSSDGIGHAFGTMNSEVGAAIRFNLFYTHRKAWYSSLTKNDLDAVENFFGWGAHVVERSQIKTHFCNSTYAGHRMECQICESVHKNNSFPSLEFTHLVDIPANLTYTRMRCDGRNARRFGDICLNQVRDFLRKHNKPKTLFQMDRKCCSSSPLDRVIDPEAKSYFFNRYWSLHGILPKDQKEQHAREELAQLGRGGGLKGLHTHEGKILSNRRIQFAEDRLIIAVHARRGDFFEVKREMVALRSFGAVIQQAMQVIRNHGGIFAQLPVSVHVYSEGKPIEKDKSIGHDIDLMTKDFYEIDGTIRDAKWIERTIRGGQETREGKDQNAGALFGNGLTVKLHISEDTLTSIHEMIAADLFIGSDSALGKFVVSSLSRGAVQLLPRQALFGVGSCCQVKYDHKSGAVMEVPSLIEYWGAYADAHEGSVRRAYYSKQIFGLRTPNLGNYRG